jgi:hypothetical protein
MFSKRVISASFDSWASTPGKKPLEYHSVIEVERANSHFSSLIEPWDGVKIPNLCLFDIYGKSGLRIDTVATRDQTVHWKKTLTQEEIDWIRNERALCTFDFDYWQTRYAFIKDADDRVMRMTPWVSQDIFLDICAEMQELGIAILLIILKARQLGLSREISLIILHDIVFQAHVNSFVASCEESKTNLLFDMYDFVLERLPFWMRPNENHRRENKFLEFGNHSAITLQHGQQATGIARGTTPTRAHISELAEFDQGRVSDLIDSSLLKAMHNAPTNFLALEGTAKGINNWWNDKWNSSKAGWPKGRSRLRPLFLPWFVGALQPDAGWVRAHPVPDGYAETMLPWAANHAKMAKAYVEKTDYLRKRLGANWQMPLEQIWFYECDREEAINENRLNKFLQETPASDDEAFQSTNISVFSTETITYYRDNAAAQLPVAIYGLIGPPEIVNPRLQPDMLARDPDKPNLVVNAANSTGYPIQFDLVPLKPVALDDGMDKIYIYEMPCAGETYGFGMDTADGIGKDRTCIEGLRKYGVNGPNRQVVEYTSDRCSALDTWPFLLAIGTLFSVPDERGYVQQPRMAIECKGQGDLPQNIIRMMGWSNFHPWNDKQLDARQPKLSQYTKIGVYTASGWFRDGMISLLVKMLRDGDIEICSSWFVHEMQSLEGEESVQSLRAGYGGHDDRIMSLGFILVSLLKWDSEFYRSAKIAAYSGKTPVGMPSRPKQYASWAYNWQERSDQGIYVPNAPHGIGGVQS